jgi:transposase
MPREKSPGKPTTRRYSPEEKAAAVRMVRTLRVELGTEHGTVQRVARQLGYGIESAVNFRFTRSGCRGAPGSALVVRTRLPRRTPSIPAARIRHRNTVALRARMCPTSIRNPRRASRARSA